MIKKSMILKKLHNKSEKKRRNKYCSSSVKDKKNNRGVHAFSKKIAIFFVKLNQRYSYQIKAMVKVS
jgi:hypothetical protein